MAIRLLTVLLIVVFAAVNGRTQQDEQKNKGEFKEYKNEFYEKMKKSLDGEDDKPPAKRFKMDFSTLEHPASADEFTSHWHNEPLSQGRTGTCWSFSTTSFFESEAYRLSGKKVKLSEVYTVYYEYVEKARRYVQKRGDSHFEQGSQADALMDIWRKYGVVPQDAYACTLPGQEFHDHNKMAEEMKEYLESVKKQNAWNEEVILETIESILQHYLNEPPETVTVDGKEYTPVEYLNEYLQLDMDDYAAVISTMKEPYYTTALYDVPDNWARKEIYHNLPLDVFMKTLQSGLEQGYTAVLGGDVSEPGYDGHVGVGVVPSFDIPSEYIDASAREYRFQYTITKDDHLIHLVGYSPSDDPRWYLIKDSSSTGFLNDQMGYYFYNEDYIKLKMLAYWVHKDVLKDVMGKFSK